MSSGPQTTPDALAEGLTSDAIDPLRYKDQQDDPHESTGILLRLLPEGARVLDVGCGTGSITKLVRDVRKCDVVGIEPDGQRAEAARKWGLNVIHGLLTPEQLPQLGTFDAVMFADVLEHLSDPAEMLRVAKLFLRPGGFVAASVPNVAHWTVRLRLLRGRFDYEATGIMDATHLRWFTRSTIVRLFESQGLSVRKVPAPSPGTWMKVYHASMPWRLLRDTRIMRNGHRRDALVRTATRAMPALFGAQWVIQGFAN